MVVVRTPRLRAHVPDADALFPHFPISLTLTRPFSMSLTLTRFPSILSGNDEDSVVRVWVSRLFPWYSLFVRLGRCCVYHCRPPCGMSTFGCFLALSILPALLSFIHWATSSCLSVVLRLFHNTLCPRAPSPSIVHCSPQTLLASLRSDETTDYAHEQC